MVTRLPWSTPSRARVIFRRRHACTWWAEPHDLSPIQTATLDLYAGQYDRHTETWIVADIDRHKLALRLADVGVPSYTRTGVDPAADPVDTGQGHGRVDTPPYAHHHGWDCDLHNCPDYIRECQGTDETQDDAR